MVAHELIKVYSVLLLFVSTIGLISMAPLSTTLAADSSLMSLDNEISFGALQNQGLESQNNNNNDSQQTQTTPSQNSSSSSTNQSKQGVGPVITPIPYSGPVWSFLGPAITRNLPTLSTDVGASCSGDQGGDSDGDAICDKWESPTTPGPPANDATHRFVTCPKSGGAPLDPLCTDNTSKYNLCFKDQYADVWNPPNTHVSGDAICPKVGHKDIFVEIDYMANHHPDDNAIKDVIKAFGNAPVINSANDDFGRSGGITLHVVLDEQLQRVNPIWAWQDNNGIDDGNYVNDFKSIKERHFGFLNSPSRIVIPPELANPADERAPCPNPLTAPCGLNVIQADLPLLLKHYVYHYNTYVVNWIGTPVNNCGPSGVSETLGNDLIVSLGCNFGATDSQGHSDPPSSVGTKDQQAGTFMHELGHSLNLGHGGPVLSSFQSSNYNSNCKPNELSVMSYSRQIPATVSEAIWETYHFLDYSRGAVKTHAGSDLKEGTPPSPPPPGPPNDNTPRLVEPDGLANSQANVIVYGTPYLTPSTRAATLTPTWSGIDWNGISGVSGTVFKDINNLGIASCIESIGNTPGGDGQIHKSMDEWNNLQYYFLNDGDGRDGFPSPELREPETELTGEMVKNLTKQTNEFSGLLDPINSNGTSSFIVGTTVPVKFQLRDAIGKFIENANVTFSADRINGSIPGSNLSSSIPGSNETLFDYNGSNHTYKYDWQTSGLQEGTWAIRCVLDFGDAKTQSTLQAAPPNPSGTSGTLILKP